MRAAACALLIAGALAAAGCGKKGPPLPPVRNLPRPPQNTHVRQIGPDVLIEATVSATRTDGSPLGPGTSVRLLRMRPAPTLRTTSVSPRYLMTIFQKEGKVVASIPGADLQRLLAAGGRIVYHDRGVLGPIPAATPQAAAGAAARGSVTPAMPRYLYAVQVIDERGQRSVLSSPQEIQLIVPPPAPIHPKAAVAEGEVRLSWEPGESSAQGMTYNVYRRPTARGEEPLVPLNVAPIAETSYVDAKFEYGATYLYSVRALTLPPPPLRESLSSEEVEARPLDVYAPKAPTGLVAAVEGQAIKLYWFPNSEPDLHGYRVYRRGPQGDPQPIGEVDAAETSFADTTAARGVRYHYTVTAVDQATPPNESPRSEEVSESLTGDAGGAAGGMGRRP